MLSNVLVLLAINVEYTVCGIFTFVRHLPIKSVIILNQAKKHHQERKRNSFQFCFIEEQRIPSGKFIRRTNGTYFIIKITL